MKIALVAATGNIGRHIAARALQRGHEAVSYTHLTLPTIYSV